MIDLNKPITLPGSKASKDAKASKGSNAAGAAKARPFSRSSKGGDTYPSKTTINLMTSGVKTEGNTLYTVLAFIVALVLIGIFCKACVVDPLASSSSIDKQVADAQAELDRLKAQNPDAAEISSEYAKYVVKDMTAEESSQVQRSVAFDLIKDRFDGVGYVSNVAISGNGLVVTLLGADMSSVSNAVAQLEKDDRVSHVTVSTAQGQDTTARSATITVILNDAQVVAAQNDSAAASAASANTGSGSGASANTGSGSGASSSAGSGSGAPSASSSSSSSKGGN